MIGNGGDLAVSEARVLGRQTVADVFPESGQCGACYLLDAFLNARRVALE